MRLALTYAPRHAYTAGAERREVRVARGVRRRSSMAEQRFCKPQVVSSSPTVGSPAFIRVFCLRAVFGFTRNRDCAAPHFGCAAGGRVNFVRAIALYDIRTEAVYKCVRPCVLATRERTPLLCH